MATPNDGVLIETQGELSYYVTQGSPTTGEAWWHWECPDPLKQGYDGVLWKDPATGNLTCLNCGLVGWAPTPAAAEATPAE
jgi:hypothetical protein